LRRKISALILLIVTLFTYTALAAGGSAADPLVTLSYLTNTYLPGFYDKANAMADTAFNGKVDAALSKLDRKASDALSLDHMADLVADRMMTDVMAAGGSAFMAGRYSELRLYAGDAVTGGVGTGFMLKSGAAALSGPAGGELLNLSVGQAVKPGAAMKANAYYMAVAADGSGVVARADSSLAVSGAYAVKRAYTPQYEDCAEGLKTMGLFLGTTYGFELPKEATRIEALVMLIRLLGEEQAALSYAGSSPFSDLDAWAVPYAAYAYNKGYTRGTSEGRFTPNAAVTADQFMTFVLRALSYSDAAGDFSWDQAVDKAVSLSVLSRADGDKIKEGGFKRDYAVYASKNALYATIKGTSTRLVDRLIASGAVSADSFDRAQTLWSGSPVL